MFFYMYKKISLMKYIFRIEYSTMILFSTKVISAIWKIAFKLLKLDKRMTAEILQENTKATKTNNTDWHR